MSKVYNRNVGAFHELQRRLRKTSNERFKPRDADPWMKPLRKKPPKKPKLLENKK